jgi:cysteine desulfurase
MFRVEASPVKVKEAMRRIYLDHNATTRLHPDARAEMAPFLDEEFGNPSSIHAAGRAARDAVERARERVARLIGAGRDEIVLTSGGTEGNNLAIRGAAEAARSLDEGRVRVLVSPVEHPSALGAAEALRARGFAVEQLRVDGAGRVDPGELERRLLSDVALVSVQLANHETGVVQPIAALADLAHARGAWFHSDVVQAAGKVALDVRALGVDAATLSAHKLYGPKGAGAIYVRGGRALAPLALGGHQERERRPGTENVAGVVGFGAACELERAHGAEWSAHVARLRDRLEAGLLALGARTNGGEPRVANTANVAFAGADGESIVINLDLAGVQVSMGAACTSGSVEPSPVLLALGQPREQAREAVRFSLGRENTEEEIDAVLAMLPAIVARVRAA